ncbi:acyl-coenzyme A diphosphatase NUDT19-like isoform X6 [Apostichopus japonicus]
MASCYHGGLSKADLRDWQKRVHNDGSSFIDLCHELKAVPDIWSLREWFHILTPQFLKKRYDTMFYLCAMDIPPAVHIDDVEMVKTEWSSPIDILKRFGQHEFTLEPPQLIQASSLQKFPDLQELHEYATKKQLLGTDDWMPIPFIAKDGLLITLPGDDLYPSDVTYNTNQQMRRLDETREEAKERCQNLFRVHVNDMRPTALFCNIQLPYGLPSPLSGNENEWKELPS